MNDMDNLKTPIEGMSQQMDAAMAEARLNMDMLLESQKEERQMIEERHSNDMEKLRKHYAKIILGLVLTLVILVGSALGGIIYVLCNYDIGIVTYAQDVYADNGSTSTVEDGIHFSKN